MSANIVSPLLKAKNRIQKARELTGGTMKMTLVAKDKEELNNLKEASKGMRGIKNLSFRLDD